MTGIREKLELDIFKNNKIFVENEEDMEVKVESEKRIRGRPKKNS